MPQSFYDLCDSDAYKLYLSVEETGWLYGTAGPSKACRHGRGAALPTNELVLQFPLFPKLQTVWTVTLIAVVL